VRLTAITAQMEFSVLVVTHKATSGCSVQTLADVYQRQVTISHLRLRHSHALKVAQDVSRPEIVLPVLLASTSLLMDTATKVVHYDSISTSS